MMANQRPRSLRLAHYDYSLPGAYFVTICTQHRASMFGKIVDSVMHLNAAGCAILTRWEDLEGRFSNFAVDEVVVMPNHLHGILLLNSGAADLEGTIHREYLGTCMEWFKSITTHDFIDGVNDDGWPAFHGGLWQRNYYEHIIRNDRDLERIRSYIQANPSRWALDEENPERISITP